MRGKMADFVAACNYFIRAVRLDGSLLLMKQKVRARGYPGVNLFYVSKAEMEDGISFTSHGCVLPRDRWYLRLEEIPTLLESKELYSNKQFWQSVARAVEESVDTGRCVRLDRLSCLLWG